MPIGKHVEQHIKDEIVLKIRDGGMKVGEAAELYGISSKTIYAWLRAGVVVNTSGMVTCTDDRSGWTPDGGSLSISNSG